MTNAFTQPNKKSHRQPRPYYFDDALHNFSSVFLKGVSLSFFFFFFFATQGIMSTPTLITVTGTPVELFPLPTPWPNNPGCADHMYRVGDSDFLKFDPEWARLFDAEASTCFPPQVSLWWYQRGTRLPLTGLGPAFACPEAYKPMLTAVIDDDTKMTYCCPS